MKGDLHTLKRVCSYASVVMEAGMIASILIAIAMLVAGVWSFMDGGVRSMFVSLIKAGSSDVALAAGMLEMTIVFVVLAVTMKCIHDMMSSVQKEHSPFTIDNADRCKKISMAFLISAPFLMVLEYLNRGDIVLTICLLLVMILISVVAYCITILFRYGSILQKESDETL